jgi:hypothetical protein
MFQLGKQLALRGCVLRSGGAKGADLSFEQGCNQVEGTKQIFKADYWYQVTNKGEY